MKKIISYIIIALSALFLFTSCGVGSYSVSSGIQDESGLCFTDRYNYQIEVEIDGNFYYTETVKAKAYKPGMDIKPTSENTIRLAPGIHFVTVREGKTLLYRQKVFLSSGEKKIIRL